VIVDHPNRGGIRMKISTRGRYGVRALFDLAYCGRQPEQIRKIAERQEIPPRYLEQIFQRLKKAGIIHTRRGAKGGYLLGRSPAEITVADVVQVTDGPLVAVVCGESRKNGHCHRADDCVIKPIWDEAGKRLSDYLRSVTLADLCERYEKRKNPPGVTED
jgi:Rrf2 family iron-sulfur cluster assembly transcriptional regulator